MNHPIPTKINLTPPLKASIKDGIWNSIMIGSGESYFGMFGIFLKATPSQVGILATLPPLFGAICQLFGVWLSEVFQSRRRVMVWGAILQAGMLIPTALLPFLFGIDSQAVSFLIILTLIYFACGGVGAPIWNSIIGDIVSPEIRGKFFGLRNNRIALTTVASILLAGFLVQFAQSMGQAALGFCALFLIACSARIISAYWLSRYEDPPYHVRHADKFSFFQFVYRAPNSNFFKFVLFVSLFNFAVNIAGPFYSLYMLRDLQLPYFQFTIISATTLVTQMITMQFWGHLTDQFGTKKILTVCTAGLVISPFLWMITSNFWVILIYQVYSGLFWAGYTLAAANFLFDAVTPAKRSRCAAYQSIINAAFIFLGSLCGGYLIEHTQSSLPFHQGLATPESNCIGLFFISGMTRLGVWLIFIRFFREVREVDTIRHRDILFRIIQIRPISGMTVAIFGRGNRKKIDDRENPNVL